MSWNLKPPTFLILFLLIYACLSYLEMLQGDQPERWYKLNNCLLFFFQPQTSIISQKKYFIIQFIRHTFTVNTKINQRKYQFIQILYRTFHGPVVRKVINHFQTTKKRKKKHNQHVKNRCSILDRTDCTDDPNKNGTMSNFPNHKGYLNPHKTLKTYYVRGWNVEIRQVGMSKWFRGIWRWSLNQGMFIIVRVTASFIF